MVIVLKIITDNNLTADGCVCTEPHAIERRPETGGHSEPCSSL